MHRRSFLVASVFGVGFAHAISIRDVWNSSHEDRLHKLPLVLPNDPDSVVLIQDFLTLIAELEVKHPIELRVVFSGAPAETLLGRIVVVRKDVAQLPLPVRRFIMAHEMGHVMLSHHETLVALYESHIPGEVTQEHTDSVAPTLGPLASLLTHRLEYEADAFAYRYIKQLGFGLSDIMPVFFQFGMQQDTATHPGTRKRLAQLRTIDAEMK